GWSVVSPTLRLVRRSSELSGLTLVNTSNVVLKATVVPEWRKIFEAEDSDLSLLWRLSHYRGKVEERYQANALIEHGFEPTSDISRETGFWEASKPIPELLP